MTLKVGFVPSRDPDGPVSVLTEWNFQNKISGNTMVQI